MFEKEQINWKQINVVLFTDSNHLMASQLYPWYFWENQNTVWAGYSQLNRMYFKISPHAYKQPQKY